MVVAALAITAAAAFSAGQWFGLTAAAITAGLAGIAWGTAKLAFDGLLQSTVPAERRGAAFTRSETLFSLAFVLGAIIPTALPMPAELGLVLTGFGALAAQIVYVVALLVPPEGPAGEPLGPRNGTAAPDEPIDDRQIAFELEPVDITGDLTDEIPQEATESERPGGPA